MSAVSLGLMLAAASAVSGLFRLPEWVPGWGLIAAAGICFFVSSHHVWRKEHLKVLALGSRRLVIAYSDGPKYAQDLWADVAGRRRGTKLYRVSVASDGQRTVENVALSLIGVEPRPPHIVLPLPLHPVHGATAAAPGIPYAGLNPGEERFFDVVQMLQMPDGPRMEVYSDAPANKYLPRGRYQLTLQATGQDAVPNQRVFLADGSTGKLLFSPVEGTAPAPATAAAAGSRASVQPRR
jgi:hypothetical protein